MIQLVSGGHCFKCLEDTIFLEIKQVRIPDWWKGTLLMIPVCEPLITLRDIELLMTPWLGLISSAENISISLKSAGLSTAACRTVLPYPTVPPPQYCSRPARSGCRGRGHHADLHHHITVQSVVRAGGVPVLVDSNPESWQMDAGQMKRR